jgi:hypothetical protein
LLKQKHVVTEQILMFAHLRFKFIRTESRLVCRRCFVTADGSRHERNESITLTYTVAQLVDVSFLHDALSTVHFENGILYNSDPNLVEFPIEVCSKFLL